VNSRRQLLLLSFEGVSEKFLLWYFLFVIAIKKYPFLFILKYVGHVQCQCTFYILLIFGKGKTVHGARSIV
jgi:hypothetical protein